MTGTDQVRAATGTVQQARDGEVAVAFRAWSALVLARLDDALDDGPEAVLRAYADAVARRPDLARVVARHRATDLAGAWRRHVALVSAGAGRDVAAELAPLVDRALAGDGAVPLVPSSRRAPRALGLRSPRRAAV